MRVRIFISLMVGAAVLLTAGVLAGVVVAAPSSNPVEHPFAIEPGTFHITPSTDQAGAHEDLTTSFDFDHTKAGKTYGDVRTIVVNLPVGFSGDAAAVPACTMSQLLLENSQATAE